MTSTRLRAQRARQLAAILLVSAGCLAFLYVRQPTYALPPNFQDTVVWSGLNLPTAVRFAPDGKVFVAEKGGMIKVFDSVDDPTPTVFADLRTEVFDFIDLGLLGLAVDPGFPTRPYIYALYSVDALPDGTPPFYHDTCDANNCPHFSRLVRLTANSSGTAMISRQIVHDGWCNMIPDHSVGNLAFGSDGFLYLSHGDGGTPLYVDYGQTNICPGDPPLEGGAVHSQDLRTAGDAVTYSGALLRINPDTFAAAPGNPLIGGAIADDDPIIATGLRNPFRFSIDSLTGRIWIGDVGWNTWEEVNTIANPTASVSNFGWPCYEGTGHQPGYESSNLPVCQSLYTTTQALNPYYVYAHAGSGASITSMALYRGSNFPSAYDGALFMGDYTRGWIKVMMPGANGLPNPGNVVDFVSGSPAVDIQIGPSGELFYVNIFDGLVRKIAYVSNNTPPVAALTTDVTSGPLPLTVHFDASMSHDPDPGDTLSYAWDLNGDGMFGDATGTNPSFTYMAVAGTTARLRVTDSHGGIDTATIVIVAGASAPVPAINAPTAPTTYRVGTVVTFAGSALDPDTGLPVAASALNWRVLLNHCAVGNPTDCHEHFLQQFSGIAGGTIQAPDHEYPSFLRFELTATKAPNGSLPALSATVSRSIYPETTTVTIDTVPTGLQVSIYGATGTAPLTRTAIVNAQTTVSAPTPQAFGGSGYVFGSWSDGGTQTHTITAPAAPLALTATYTVPSSPLPSVWNSWDVVTQSGSPQGMVTAAGSGAIATIEFYESTNDGGVLKGSLFGGFTAAPHPGAFNNLERYWGTVGGDTYPYAGKSTVNRGADAGETNASMPLGVRDLQLHPPNNLHYVVAAFRAPSDGTYAISNLGVRRVSNLGGPVILHVLNAQQAEIAALQATTSRAWVTSPTTYTLSNVPAGAYLYFSVDRAGDFFYDATEISWTVTATVGPAAPVPSCTLSAVPGTVDQNMPTTLTWTSANTTTLSIDQGVGTVTPAGGGSLPQTAPGTRTYTATATGPGGTATCTTTVTVNPPAGTQSTWNSWDVVTQNGPPQGLVTAATGAVASVEFYESTNNGGVLKGTLFPNFTDGPHPHAFNNAEKYWAAGTGGVYPHAGKSTVNRGSDAGETNSPMPLGVRDLQLHPPNNLHTVVAAFRAPSDGTYAISNLGVRRVSNLGGPVGFHLFNAQQVEVVALQATANQAWSVSPTTYTVPSVTAGSYLYFAVENGGDYAYDATEVSWSVTLNGGGGSAPPAPTCTLVAMPSSVSTGTATTLTWTTLNATGLSIIQGVGAVTPVTGGSLTPTPAATTTYTATATGPGGTVMCSASVTVIPPAGTLSIWNSWDVATQSGSPQGLVTATTGTVANLEFYESTNNGGVLKGGVFGGFTSTPHPGAFNNLERYWGAFSGDTYPYAGKSTVNRGAGAGETNAPLPLSVRDLQLHPPNNLHFVVAAFQVPQSGSYAISNLGVRRVHNLGGPVIFHVFDAQQVEIAMLQATSNRAWVTSPTTYTLPNLTQGSYLYFAVDRAGDFNYDATEIAWTVTRTGP